MLTVASRRKLLLEPASSATDAATTDSTTAGVRADRKICSTDASAAGECADTDRQAIVDRRVHRIRTAVGAWITRIAVNSTAANYDRKDSAEDAADVAAAGASFALTATNCR